MGHNFIDTGDRRKVSCKPDGAEMAPAELADDDVAFMKDIADGYGQVPALVIVYGEVVGQCT